MAGIATMPTLDAIMVRIERIVATADAALAVSAPALAHELLLLGEASLENWLVARSVAPTRGTIEGFRLLALHRQGSQGDPSFNACRETCRELVYHHNLVCLAPADPEIARRIRLGAMVARHLALFIAGKLDSAGLGEFCCSSRPLRAQDALRPPNAESPGHQE